MLEGSVDGEDGKDSVFAHIRMAMFEAGAASWYQGFEKFGVFGEFLEETEGSTSYVFVGMLLEGKLKAGTLRVNRHVLSHFEGRY